MYEMRIYLLNNTQPYRDDEDEGYTGGWFNCPVDLEEVRERLGVENEEQLEIADYELPFEVHSEMPLWEINVKCRMVQEMEGTPIGNEMKSIIQRWFYGFDEFIDHKDEIRYYDVADGAALAEYLICEEEGTEKHTIFILTLIKKKKSIRVFMILVDFLLDKI